MIAAQDVHRGDIHEHVAARTRDAGEVHETRLRIRKQLEDLDRVHRVVRATEDLLQPRLADVSALEVEVREVPQRALQLAHVALGDVHQRDRADLPREVERGEAAAGTDLQQVHRARQGQVLEQHLVANREVVQGGLHDVRQAGHGPLGQRR